MVEVYEWFLLLYIVRTNFAVINFIILGLVSLLGHVVRSTVSNAIAAFLVALSNMCSAFLGEMFNSLDLWITGSADV